MPKRFIAVRHHRDHIAEDIIGVSRWICCSTLVGLAAAKIVLIDDCVAEGISDGCEIAERVVGVGCAVAKGVDISRTLAVEIVFHVAGIATAIGVGDLATKGIVCDSVGNGRNGDIHQRDAVAGNREGLVGRVGDCLARGDDRGINQRFVHRDVAADVERA